MILFTALAAFGATYDVELAIPSSYPNYGSGGLAGFERVVAQAQHPDLKVLSTDSRVECGVRDGFIYVAFSADDADWPALPLTASCTYKGDSINIDVVAMNPALDYSNQPATLVNGNDVILKKIYDVRAVHTYPLPSGTYTPGLYTSTLTATRCRVLPGASGSFVVRIESGSASGSGVGTCNLPRPGLAPFVLDLDVQEVSI